MRTFKFILIYYLNFRTIQLFELKSIELRFVKRTSKLLFRMALNVLLSVSLLLALCYARSNPPSYCLPIQPITQDIQIQPQPEVMTQQGRPGRIGPIGPIGPRGLQGSPGTPGSCACEASETEQLRMEMQRMRG